MHAQWRFVALKQVGEIQFHGGIVNGIAAGDDQKIDFASADVGGQLFDRISLVYRICDDGIGLENCFANVAKALIERVSQGVNFSGLMIARDHNR
jgi:hypothetical protein